MPVVSRQEAEETIRRWYDTAVLAVDPSNALRTHLSLDDNALQVARRSMPIGGRVFVAAVGKAALGMSAGASAVLGERITGGLIITKDDHLNGPIPDRFEVFEAAHPIPDDRGATASARLLSQISTYRDGDIVVALISGGGSALLEVPVDGVSLGDVAATTALLLRAGAPIHVLNAVRVPLSQVKGGGLRRGAPMAGFVTLLLSDVFGNDPAVIASGPTVPTSFTAAGSAELLKQYGVFDRVPSAVRDALANQSESRDDSIFQLDIVTVIGDNEIALEAFANAAKRDGHRANIAWHARQGEARDLAGEWVEQLESIPSDVNLALGGGEATVTVRGDGLGGRNTEFALAAGLELERRGVTEWVVASLATDGQDALTGVAGAVVSADTIVQSRTVGIDAAAALEQNNSLAVFEAVGGIVAPGPTGTNVNDIYIALRVRNSA